MIKLKRHTICVAILVLATSIILAQSKPIPTSIGSPEASNFIPESPGASVVLSLTQPNNMLGGVASQEFETSLSSFDVEAADDFIIPSGPDRVIVSVDIEGIGTVSAGATIDMNVYQDAGGLPGVLVFTETFSSPSATSFTLTSTSCPPLSSGTYWLSIVVDEDFNPGNNQWFWSTSSTDLTGSPWAIQNPDNGFGTGCTSWIASENCSSGFFGGAPSTGPGLNYVINLGESTEIIPTLGEWGVINMILILLIVGVLAVKEKKEVLWANDKV